MIKFLIARLEAKRFENVEERFIKKWVVTTVRLIAEICRGGDAHGFETSLQNARTGVSVSQPARLPR